MQTCEFCPKPPRCMAREKCFEGRLPYLGEVAVSADPEPMRVLTTTGYEMTSKPKKTKKRKVK